jgi:FNIP Repeat
MSESDITDQYGFPALPDTVTDLKLPAEYTHYIGNLPSQLEILDTGYKYNKALGVLPATLKELYIKCKADDTQQYEHDLGALPYGLKILHVANMTHSLGVLRNALKVLKIDGSNFNHPLGLLPDGLVELDLSTAGDFQQPLGILPAPLQTIKLHSNYRPLPDEHAAAAVVVEAVIDESVHTNSAQWFKRAAATVAAAAVTTAVLYGEN